MQKSIPIHAVGQHLDYELIDTGNFEKLERFGKYVVRRPEPQALWDMSMLDSEWQRMADATYMRLKQSHYRDAEDTGSWQLKPGVKEPWPIVYQYQGRSLTFKLGFTAFKHVGIFPEQSCNWDWIAQFAQQHPGCRVLNLFAYTGAASIVACAFGAEVTHLDAVKSMITWSRENLENNQLNGVRWVVEDAPKFVEREGKRQNKYDLIIMDPPAYGRGPAGEKWVLESMLTSIIRNAKSLLTPHGKILLNLYSLNHSALVVQNYGSNGSHWGESVLSDRAGRYLPLGIFGVLD